jgi:thiosulfate reductase cytochrome b subunit/cytochrome c553
MKASVNFSVQLILITAIGLLALALTGTGIALAQEPENSPGGNLHPSFPILDAAGQNVLDTGNPISTMNTCGGCHDTAFIADHSFHSTVGLNDMTAPGQVPGGHTWDTSPGLFGKWNPITYRYLSPEGDKLLDLSTADWIRIFGARHVGGGPALTDASGVPLTDLPADANSFATSTLNPATGQPEPWDWTESGTVEMNCFLCHTPAPNSRARNQVLEDGKFAWANTATLLGTGIVTETNGELAWNPQAFTADGNLAPEYVTLQDPTNSNCGQCHGLVHTTNETPVVLQQCDWQTATTGEIFSPQRLNATGMNLAGKQDLSRAWDIHAERVVDCVDCHPSTNNPVHFQGSKDNDLDHLIFDARRIGIENFLYQPSHQFAKGQSVQGTVAPEYNASMRRCEGCHDPTAVHDWLPYKETHFASVSCEGCHIPQMRAPAFQQLDWTVVNLEGENLHICRGADGDPSQVETLITGFEPVLLPQQLIEGGTPLRPFNLVASWYWVYGQPERPVRQIDLQAAYLDGDNYRADVLEVFDHNRNGLLEERELRLNTPNKEALIKKNLQALGLTNLHIRAEVQPYSISHNVVNGEWATKECTTCHGPDSRIAAPMQLATYMPGGVLPQFFGDEQIPHTGSFEASPDGSLHYQPDAGGQGLYLFGYSSVPWIDWLGVLAFLGTIAGVTAHAGLRFYAAVRAPYKTHQTKEVYMYTVYERLWHWLQAAAIFILIFTGLIIHKPEMFGLFSFSYVVQVHNVVGFILLANAFLAVFYHLASGEIRQYIPKPSGFFYQMITQATYYLRGIFKNEEHPFEKTPNKKLNPLQQITYFGLLNVLLPLQVITGVLIWGIQIWPDWAQTVGGLPLLAPLHTLIAWLLASFIVMHMYLTTTGHTVLGGVQSMINGWDEVEVHGDQPHSGRTPKDNVKSGQLETI